MTASAAHKVSEYCVQSGASIHFFSDGGGGGKNKFLGGGGAPRANLQYIICRRAAKLKIVYV